MKIISARQSWHDAFYTRSSSLMSNDEGGCGYHDDSAAMMHRTIAGRAQLAISLLPDVFKRFGMIMYAPQNFIVSDDIECVVAHIDRKVQLHYAARPLSSKKSGNLSALIRAMLTKYRAVAVGGLSPFSGDDGTQSSRKLRRYLLDECGVMIPASAFSREYGHILNCIEGEIDVIDRLCLVPLSKVVRQYKLNLDESDAANDIVSTERNWEKCFAKIKAQCLKMALDMRVQINA